MSAIILLIFFQEALENTTHIYLNKLIFKCSVICRKPVCFIITESLGSFYDTFKLLIKMFVLNSSALNNPE